MISTKDQGGNGERIPGWFKSFLNEYRKDRHETALRFEKLADNQSDLAGAVKILAENQQHTIEEVRELSVQFHEAQKETQTQFIQMKQEQARTNQELTRTNQELTRTNQEINRTNQELKRTRHQTAKLFARLIDEVKALRNRR